MFSRGLRSGGRGWKEGREGWREEVERGREQGISDNDKCWEENHSIGR